MTITTFPVANIKLDIVGRPASEGEDIRLIGLLYHKITEISKTNPVLMSNGAFWGSLDLPRKPNLYTFDCPCVIGEKTIVKAGLSFNGREIIKDVSLHIESTLSQHRGVNLPDSQFFSMPAYMPKGLYGSFNISGSRWRKKASLVKKIDCMWELLTDKGISAKIDGEGIDLLGYTDRIGEHKFLLELMLHRLEKAYTHNLGKIITSKPEDTSM